MTRLNKLAFVLICFIVVFTTMAYGTVHPPIIAFFYLLIGSVTIVWIVDCAASGELHFSRCLLQLPLYALAFYGFIQVIPLSTYADAIDIADIPRRIALEPFATQVTSLHILGLGLFFSLTLAYLQTARRLQRTVNLLIIFGFIYSFYAVLQSLLSPNKIFGIYESRFAIPFGSFVNRHDFAALIEMLISIPLGLLFVGAVRRDKRLLYAIAVTLMTVALLLSGSRGGLVAFIAELILLVIFTTKASGTKSVVLKTALSLLLAVAAFGGTIFVGGDTSLTRFADSASSNDVTSNRIHIWGVTLRVISENMPFGAGLGGYAQAYTRFDTLSGLQLVEQAHNDYLQILADAGVIGFVIGAAFLYLFFREGIRNSRSQNILRRGIATGAFAGCFAVLIHSIFDFVLHITAISVLFLLLLALLVAAGREYKDDIRDFDGAQSRRRSRRSASVTQIVERMQPND